MVRLSGVGKVRTREGLVNKFKIFEGRDASTGLRKHQNKSIYVQ
jgi:hypothetical protein